MLKKCNNPAKTNRLIQFLLQTKTQEVKVFLVIMYKEADRTLKCSHLSSCVPM